MEKPFIRSSHDLTVTAIWWVYGAFVFGLAMGVMLTAVWCEEVHAEQYLWGTPEVQGTFRDNTNLPALPFFPMNPSNLQHQAWAQPQAPASYGFGYPPIPTTPEGDYFTGPQPIHPAARAMLKKMVEDFEKKWRPR